MTVLPRPWTFQGWWPLDFTLDFAGLLDFHGPLCSWFGHVLRRPWRFLAVICESALSGCLDFVPCGPCLSRLLACSLSWFRVVLTVTWLLLVLFLPRLPRLATRPHQVVGSSLSVMPPRLRLWLCFLCLWRVGEAYKPGPEFTVGVANLNGLHNKAFGFADSDVHTWILSETHLTKGVSSVFSPTCARRRPPTRPSSMGVLLPPDPRLLTLGNGPELEFSPCSRQGGCLTAGLLSPMVRVGSSVPVFVHMASGFLVLPFMELPPVTRMFKGVQWLTTCCLWLLTGFCNFLVHGSSRGISTMTWIICPLWL